MCSRQELPAQYFEKTFDAVHHDLSLLPETAHIAALEAAADARIAALEVLLFPVRVMPSRLLYPSSHNGRCKVGSTGVDL